MLLLPAKQKGDFMDFENKLKRLEAIVEKLEKGDCSLDEATELFKEGVTLSKECNKQLEAAKQCIISIDDEENANA